jgi:hypothetical protein
MVSASQLGTFPDRSQGTTMQIATNTDEQVLSSLNNMDARRHQTDAVFRYITALEANARRQKTARLRAARMQSSVTKQ